MDMYSSSVIINKNCRIRYVSKILLLLVMAAASFAFLACGKEGDGGNAGQAISDSEIHIYYLNKDETALVYKSYDPSGESQEEQLREIILQMQTVPDDVDMKAPMLMGFGLLSYYMEGTQMVVQLDEYYRQLSPSTEILVRAAIVRTLTQIDGIDCISITIGETPLTDHAGNPLGVLTADMFIDNEGSEINAYEQTALHLYFANETGDALIEVEQTVVYNSNISLERVVIDQLIAGPDNIDSYPVINPDTKVNSVTITDGVCYVNLDDTFLTQPYNVTPEVTVYAIVNSLAELSNVNRVQIMISGETAVQYRDNISFETTFTRNLDLVE